MQADQHLASCSPGALCAAHVGLALPVGAGLDARDGAQALYNASSSGMLQVHYPGPDALNSVS